MIIYFENSKEELRKIGEAKTLKEINNIIQSFLDDHHFKSYYTQVTLESSNRVILDVGSHTEFFIVTNEDDKSIDLFEIYKMKGK